MKNNYDIYTNILICFILLFYTYIYIFIYNDQEKYNSFEEMIFCYVIFLIIISKYQFNIALCIFVISIFCILYIIYEDNKYNNNNQYNNQYNNKNNQYNNKYYRYNNQNNNKYYRYNNQNNNQYYRYNNNKYNNNKNNKYQFNYDPNIKLNREDIINLDKLIDSDKTDVQKCILGFGIDKRNDLKIKKKICRPLLKKYHSDKINKDISNEEQRNKISTQFNNCCYN